MPTITTRAAGGSVAVFCGRVRVGYVSPSGGDGEWLWELGLRSEALRARPAGRARSRSEAVQSVVRGLHAWLVAADLDYGVQRQFVFETETL